MDSSSPPHLLMAALLYEVRPPALDKAALTGALRQFCGQVEPFGDEANLFFAFPEHRVTYADGQSIPAQATIFDSFEELTPKQLPEPALAQTWDWPEARQVVERCRTRIMVNEMMAGGLPREERLPLFYGVVKALLAVAPCQALHWWSSERVVEPAAFLRAREPGGGPALFPAANVRMFNIKDRPAERVMDSLGLATFGLPDVQCHFTGLEPEKVARLLYNAATYLFDAGDVIEDGHTIDGIEPGQQWRCQHEMSLVGPRRMVLDVDPGPPFAAGNRGE
jgi:hypothetical protein